MQKGDEASRALLGKVIITLEPHGIFGSNFVSLCILTLSAISKNINRFIFILSVQGIIGNLGRPGKSASGYSVFLGCHWRVSP